MEVHMKRLLIAAALSAATFAIPSLAADVGVSINIGQPGFFGRIDIGDFPQPQLINRQPMIIERGPSERPPIYLRVPPNHAKHWKKHCREYNACGERVFFVQDNWYNREYVPRYQEQHRENRGERRDEHRNDRRDERRDERSGDNNGNRNNERQGENRGRDRER
jgi:hypothetical protein